MRALLDESLPLRLATEFKMLEVETVYARGWTGLKNGELLTKASADFDIFVTADQNLRYQQNLSGFDIAVIVLAAPTNRMDDLRPLIPLAEEASTELSAGDIRIVRAADKMRAT